MFLKTNNPEAVKALRDFNDQKKALHAAAKALADAFDAKPIVTSGVSSIDYAGFVFNNPSNINFDVWRKPSPSNFRISNLRVRPVKKEFQAEWDAANQKFDELKAKHFPNGTSVAKDGIYKALGFDWGDLLFSGFGCFLYDGYIYMDTGIKGVLGDEILGSEYDEAHRKFKEQSDANS